MNIGVASTTNGLLLPGFGTGVLNPLLVLLTLQLGANPGALKLLVDRVNPADSRWRSA